MGSKTNSHLHDQWVCHHGDLTTTYSGIMEYRIGRGYHCDHLDDETHIFVWASCFWFCIPPPRPPPRPPPPPPRHPPSFTHNFVTLRNTVTHQLCHHHLSHTIFHIPLCHAQIFTYNLFYFSFLHHILCPFLPSPSPLQHLLLIIIGRSWLVGLSGPFIFFFKTSRRGTGLMVRIRVTIPNNSLELFRLVTYCDLSRWLVVSKRWSNKWVTGKEQWSMHVAMFPSEILQQLGDPSGVLWPCDGYRWGRSRPCLVF